MIVKIDDQSFDVQIEDLTARPVIVLVDGLRFEVWPDNGARLVEEAGSHALLNKPTQNGGASRNEAPPLVRAPIPGVIVAVHVKPGDQVSTGQHLCMLEAMKMKNAIRSPREGQIASVFVSPGQQVSHHETLFEFVS